MRFDYRRLLRSVTVDEAASAREVFHQCMERGASQEKALGVVWRASRISTRWGPCETCKHRPAPADDLGPIELEEGVFDE